MNHSQNLIAMKKELDDREFRILQSELERRKKSVSLTYVLWFFLSFIGIHKFYLGRIWEGIFYIIAPFIAFMFLFIGLELSEGVFLAGIGFMGLIVYAILWFIDLFTIPNQVDKYNEGIEIETIESLFEELKNDKFSLSGEMARVRRGYASIKTLDR